MRIAIAALFLALTSTASAQVGDSTRRDTAQRVITATREAQLKQEIERALAKLRIDEIELKRQLAAEADRIASLQMLLAQITPAEHERARLALRLTDSVLVVRAAELFQTRAISRRDFVERVGPSRSDSIIREMQRSLQQAVDSGTLQRLTETVTRLQQSAAQQAAVEAKLSEQMSTLRFSRDSIRLRSNDTLSIRNNLNTTMRTNAFTRMADNERRLALVSSRLPMVSLGMGLMCSACSFSQRNGLNVWVFSSYPAVGAIERGSMAERLGLRTGDTLRTVDDISLITPQGGERLSALAPGSTVKLGWRRNGVAMSGSVAIPPADNIIHADNIRLTQVIGNARVEVRGRQAFWTRDPQTGVLRITGDSVSVTIVPPGGVAGTRDTLRRVPTPARPAGAAGARDTVRRIPPPAAPAG